MRSIASRKFKKQYKKLPEKIRAEFKRRFSLFAQNPSHPLLRVHSLTGGYQGHKSFNVNADIRCVFKEIGLDIVELVAIGSHQALYE